MAYILDGTEIRAPHELSEKNDSQYAQNRTLDGQVNRDYFGDNKRVWRLQYKTTNATDYAVIRAIYNSYLSNAIAKSWSVTEPNYTISATTVHIDLIERGFNVKGEDYLSNFDLILTEA